MELYDYNGVPILKETEPLNTDIPEVYIDGTIPTSKGDGELPVKLVYVSKTAKYITYAKIKVQGDSSTAYPKKNFTIKLFSDAQRKSKYKINFKGWGEYNKYVLKANWIDITHSRNICCARLWGDVVKSREDYLSLPAELRNTLNSAGIDGFPVIVYANGIYQGRYTWNIPKDGFMLGMDEDNPNHMAIQPNGGTVCNFRSLWSENIGAYTDELRDDAPSASVQLFDAFMSFVQTSNNTNFVNHLTDYVDVPSFLMYECFQNAISGFDSTQKNHFFLTYDGTKFIASAYDMDSTFGLHWNGGSILTVDHAWRATTAGETHLLYDRIDELFASELQAEYARLREGPLSFGNIMHHFEEFISIVPPYIVSEDYAVTTADGAYVDIPSKDITNIQQIRDYAKKRLDYVDEWYNLT